VRREELFDTAYVWMLQFAFTSKFLFSAVWHAEWFCDNVSEVLNCNSDLSLSEQFTSKQ
jgi:hypothetical protein